MPLGKLTGDDTGDGSSNDIAIESSDINKAVRRRVAVQKKKKKEGPEGAIPGIGG